MIIAVGAEKGGCGKSTHAVNLAVRFMQDGASVILVDTDTTRSATQWGEVRQHFGVEPHVGVVSASSEAWPTIRDLATKYDVVVVDVGARDYGKIDELAKRVDLWLAPTGISQPDLDSTVRLCGALRALDRFHVTGQVPVRVVLNGIPSARNSGEAAEARSFLEEMVPTVRLLDGATGDRKAWRDVFKTGRAVTELARSEGQIKSAAELDAIFEELRAVLEAQAAKR